MQLKAKSLEELKTIVQSDYGIELTEDDLNHLGSSLLKLSRIAMTALDRSEVKPLTEKG